MEVELRAKINVWIIDSGSLLCALMVLTTPLTLPLLESSKCPCWKVRASIGSTISDFLRMEMWTKHLKKYQKLVSNIWMLIGKFEQRNPCRVIPKWNLSYKKVSKCWSVFWCALAMKIKVPGRKCFDGHLLHDELGLLWTLECNGCWRKISQMSKHECEVKIMQTIWFQSRILQQ